ncbi:MAG TPA: WD40 repeat domain-containing protein [Gemmata sp.]|nr:WD40 repeat domain-containing protein [Gemmata sp.]
MNLDGPVRVANTAGSGSASVTLSFDAWKEAEVAPTTHSVHVMLPKVATKTEAVAKNLVATLTHPDRRASVWSTKFSPDGTRLVATGYPSGVVQIFDVAGRKELRRVETPAGYRGSADYALITPDWKTLYVPVEKRVPRPIEKEGKKLHRIEYSGSIRVWDLETGEEQAPLKPPEGTAPIYGLLSPDGNLMVSVERASYDTDGTGPKERMVVWDLKTRKARAIADEIAIPVFSLDGKKLAILATDRAANKTVVRILNTTTFEELARLDCSDKGRQFSVSGFSPDGSVLALSAGGKKDAPREVWFRDGRTLADRGRFVGEGDPDRYGWGDCEFTPDGRHCVVLGVKGKVAVWDVAGKKVAREFEVERSRWKSAVSPDGTTLAVPWMPRSEKDDERVREPDPQDYPQPRVTLYDLTGKNPPRTLVAPHGFVGGVAFSPDGKTLAFGTSGAVRLFDLTK